MEGDMRVFAALVCSALVPGAALAGGSFPAHRGDSPWSFTIVAEPSDTFVVNDTDSGTIDTFLFRSEGPIVIEVPIHRYVGRTDADGHLLDVEDLVKRGIVSERQRCGCRPSTWTRRPFPSSIATATASTTS